MTHKSVVKSTQYQVVHTPVLDRLTITEKGQTALEQFTSEAALLKFKQISELRLPMCHSTQKYLFSSVAYLVGALTPLAAFGGTLGYLAYRTVPKTPEEFFSMMGLLFSQAGGAAFATAGTMYAFRNRAPISTLTNLLMAVTAMVSAKIITRCADGLSDAVARPYREREKAIETDRAQLKVLLVRDLMHMYWTAAKELSFQYKRVLDDPKGMYELKLFVQGFEKEHEKKMMDAFKQLNLSISDQADILDPFHVVIRDIKSYQLCLRPNDPEYNIKLMEILPEDAFKQVGLAPETIKLLRQGAVAPLGCTDKLTSVVETAAKGTVCGLGAFAAAYVAVNGLEYAIELPGLAGISRVIGGTAVFASTALTMKSVWERREQERVLHNRMIDVANKKAAEQLTMTYKGMADYLKANPTLFADEVSKERLLRKLTLIEQQIASYALPKPKAVTKDLRKILTLQVQPKTGEESNLKSRVSADPTKTWDRGYISWFRSFVVPATA